MPIARRLPPMLAALVLSSCGAPALPTGPDGATPPPGGGGKYQCKNVTGKTDPWLVEWDATHKARMQAASHKGVLLVRYSGCELEVLYGCEQAGAYEIIPTTPSTNTEYITNEDDVFAKLPIGALRLVAEFKQGDKWSLDYAILGMQQTAANTVSGAQLKGDCARATHFVSAMAVGAYRLVSEAKRNAETGVEVFGAGAGASTGGAAGLLRQAGRYEKCASGANANDTDCQAVVQLFLTPLDKGAAAIAPDKAPAEAAPQIEWATGQRFGKSACGMIVDSQTKLEWLVGPNETMSWKVAMEWTARQTACGGGWRMPTIQELKTLFVEGSTAGTGYYSNGKRFKAKMHPVFDGIGEGAWVWSSEQRPNDKAGALNFFTGNGVTLDNGGTEFTTRAFGVR